MMLHRILARQKPFFKSNADIMHNKPVPCALSVAVCVSRIACAQVVLLQLRSPSRSLQAAGKSFLSVLLAGPSEEQSLGPSVNEQCYTRHYRSQPMGLHTYRRTS